MKLIKKLGYLMWKYFFVMLKEGQRCSFNRLWTFKFQTKQPGKNRWNYISFSSQVVTLVIFNQFTISLSFTVFRQKELTYCCSFISLFQIVILFPTFLINSKVSISSIQTIRDVDSILNYIFPNDFSRICNVSQKILIHN